MNPKPTLCLISVLLSISALRADPVINLSEWGAGDTSTSELVQNNKLVLPAGAQLYRVVTGGGVTFKITSTPIFSTEPEEVAILEFGTNALAFMQSSEIGRIILLQGDLEPQFLSYEIALDDTGRAAEVLALNLTQRGQSLFLSTQGQTLQLVSEPLTETTEIVLSSGANQSWEISELRVTTEPQYTAGSAATREPGGSSSGDVTDQTSEASSPNSLPGIPEEAADDASSAVGGSTSADVQQAHRRVRLEVFTPPAVRRGRSAAVRAALIQANLN